MDLPKHDHDFHQVFFVADHILFSGASRQNRNCACILETGNLEPLKLLATDPKIWQHLIFCSMGLLSFQKAYLSKNFLISDCSVTPFYTVSVLSCINVIDSGTPAHPSVRSDSASIAVLILKEVSSGIASRILRNVEQICNSKLYLQIIDFVFRTSNVFQDSTSLEDL